MIAVVGAGYAGAATAWWLARKGHGHEVILLESEPRVGEHASGRNAGLVMSMAEDPDVSTLTVRGARLLRELGFLTGSGSVLLVEGQDEARRLLERAERFGLRAEIRMTSDLSERIPLISGSSSPVALVCHDDGKLDPRATLDRYIREATEGGVRLITGTRVTRLLQKSGRVTGLETTRGRFDADCVVNAAGAWAGAVGELSGLTDLDLRAYRRHIFRSRPVPGIDGTWPFVWDLANDVYFRVDDGRVLMSACDEQPHAPGRPEPSQRAGFELRDKLTRFMPGLLAFGIEGSHACLRTFAPDRRYVIGPDPRLEGFQWVAGLGGTGATASAAVGEIASDLIMGSDSPGELQAKLSPCRLVRTKSQGGPA